jgi:probable HAF family extracellular repeat protein
MNDLGTLGGNSMRIIHRSEAINASGEVVGMSYTAGGDAHAFIWLPADAYGLTAGMSDLGTLAGGDTSWAFGINDSGRVVGTSNVTGGDFHAFVWEDGTMYDVNDVLDPNDGWEMLWATAVNSDGEITGWATNGSGDTQAVLLTQACSGGAEWGGPPPDEAEPVDLETEGALLTPTACGAGACGAGAAPFGLLGMGALIGARRRRQGRQSLKEPVSRAKGLYETERTRQHSVSGGLAAGRRAAFD